MKLLLSILAVLLELNATGETAKLCAARDLVRGHCDNRIVRLRGTVKDVSRDDVDPDYFYFSILSDGLIVYAATHSGNISDEMVRRFINADVEVTGQVQSRIYDSRLHIGHLLKIPRLADIAILRAAETDRFNCPDIDQLALLHASELMTISRAKARGRVLAVWNNDTALVRTPSNQISRLRLDASSLPALGTIIEAAGFPDTDLHNLNLSHVHWRPAAAAIPPEPAAEAVTVRALMTDERGRLRFRPKYHGRAIRLRGKAITEPSAENPGFMLDDGFHPVQIDLSGLGSPCPAIRLGSELEATGICIINTDSISSDSVFPKIRSFSVIVCSPDDVKIIAQPSWWTPRRLFGAIGTLFAILLAVLIWNLSLNRLAHKRGRELFEAQVDKVTSELRIDERTRLAVELHDAISQNLTGVSMQIDAAARFATSNTEKTLRHLDIASRTLDSCRTELRNCIWDLRHEALEEKDFNAAIRTALVSQSLAADLHPNVTIPRNRLTETTAHALLCIIRELVTNAVRHGHARTVTVRGSIRERLLEISVADDGCGFNPECRPGPASGHFGLSGIAERIRPFNGRMEIESSPQTGTTVSITLASPLQEES